MSRKIYFVISIILALIFGYLSFWHFTRFRQTLPEVKLPEIKMPEIKLEEILPPEKQGYKEWSSPDGKLKLKHRASWLEAHKMLLEQFQQQEPLLPEIKTLFFAFKFDLKTRSSAFLMIGEMAPEKTLEQIIENMERKLKEEDREMEIVSLEKENNFAYLETKTAGFQTKMKIIFAQEKTYLISFSGPEKDWLELKEERNKIFDSIEFTP